MVFSNDQVANNRFLGGKLHIWQPLEGYRAGADPVFLAAAVAAKPGQSVLDLGCGVGVASLCLGWRTPGLRLTGVELQPDYADLARLNAKENKIEFEVIDSDLLTLPDHVRDQSFDHVLTNPPFFHPDRRTNAKNEGREISRAGKTGLGDWLDQAIRRLKPQGILTLIQKPERLPETLAAFTNRMGEIRVKPLIPRTGRGAELVIVRAKKASNSPFRLLSSITLHQGQRHTGDACSYTNTIQGILRNAKPLTIDG